MVWASSAAVGQADDISAGTTPRRYVSSGRSLVTVTLGVTADVRIRSTPRYSSHEVGLDHSWRRVVAALPRTTSDDGFGPAYRSDPSAAVTLMSQVVDDTPAVTVVFGMTRRTASAGNVAATPSTVHGARRPKISSGFVGAARQPYRIRTRMRVAGSIEPRVVPG